MADLLLDPVALTAFLSLMIVVLAVFAYQRQASASAPEAGKLLERFLLPFAIMQLGFLLLAATPAVVNRFLHYTENLVEIDERCIEEMSPLVVLSGGVSSAVRSTEDLGSVYEATFVRMAEAIALIRQQSARDYDIYLVGGSMRRGIAEADVMQHFFELTGVAQTRLITERQSSNTAESAIELARMFETAFEAASESANRQGSLQAPKIRLLTSALHMARARAVFVSQGFDVCPVHVDRRAIPDVPWRFLIPQLSVLKKFDALLHEWIGILFYKFKGYL